MGYNSPDPYNNPEHFGLTQVGMLDDDGSYEFDYVVLWKHDDGRIFYAADSGCSCPSPFEDFTKLEDLWHLTEENFKAFEDTVKNWNPSYYDGEDPKVAVQRNEFKAKAWKLLKENKYTPVES